MFRDNAPLSAAEAATIILDGVRPGSGASSSATTPTQLDAAVRADPKGPTAPTASP